MMLRHFDVYQAVRSVSRVFAKVGDVPTRERPCFPIGDIGDCLVEISANHEWPELSLAEALSELHRGAQESGSKKV
ncbi:MAG: hypothetical protein Udaeo2_00200 [Candidatus Udaeobacter sp.]|nr:MAG: hypothetical protein Udaeo2_00200 [Candidatus Udaeobacter sp.]